MWELLKHLYSPIQDEDYGEDTQGDYQVIPSLQPGQKNYNQTPGNPPVTLDDGWLRSLIPFHTAQGGPPGMYQDDGRDLSLYEKMFRRNPSLIRHWNGEAKKNQEPPLPPDLGRMIIQMLEEQHRDKYRGML